MRKIALVSIGFMFLVAALDPAWGAVPDVMPGLEALRSGRFEEAGIRFKRITFDHPTAPEGPFFEAFLLWWKLLDRPRNDQLRTMMEEHLTEASRRAKLLESSADSGAAERGFLYTGVSLLMDAHSKASHRAHLSAAASARKGHAALSRALRERPDSPDALFAMGAYNYYADNLPLLVKGLRIFLLIPGGDEKRGIVQLEMAGLNSRLFSVESLMLLAHIFSGGYEEDYRRALGYVEAAVALHPTSPLLALMHADMLFRQGRLRESADGAGSALAILRAGEGYPDELRRAALHRAAACTLKMHDPLGALQQIESSLEISQPRDPHEKRRWASLLAAAAREAGRPERAEVWMARLDLSADEADSLRRKIRTARADPVAGPRAQALRALASGQIADATRQIEALLVTHQQDPRLRYDLGRLLQQQGQMEKARPHLQAVSESAPSALLGDLAGWAMIRLGWDLERSGRRAQAIRLYRRAAEMKLFTFRDAARDLVAHPAIAQPEG